MAGSSNEPTALLEKLAATDLPKGLHFIQFPLAGYNQCDFTRFGPDTLFTTFFMTPHLREVDPTRLRFLPMHMRAVYDYLSSGVDVVLLQVSRNAAGELCIGPNVDFAQAALGCAGTLIVELNRAFVAPAGCPVIDERRIDHVFESNRPLFQLAAPRIDASARRIGELVSELICDGDCIQTGIGGIPAAILARLGDKNDLGMHGGIVDDGGMYLIKNGNLNGLNKPMDTGRHVAGMALGSHGLIEWLAQSPQVLLRPANYTHEVSIIAQLPQFVSVNSAVEVDLYGQVNAEVAGGRQISGTGGSVDFMRAAKASRGGRSIVAMNATARKGAVSRIVPKVELVTALRTDVDMVVTEFGVARLKTLPVRERALALIEVAAPEFRDGLRAELPS